VWSDIWTGLLHGGLYVVLSMAILVFGVFVHDILTPGKIGQKGKLLIEGNPNVAVLTVSYLVASGFIAVAAIWTTHSELGRGLLSTAIFGAVGIIVLAVTETVVDKLTPGDLRDYFCEPQFQPVTAVTAAANIMMGLIVAVSIL